MWRISDFLISVMWRHLKFLHMWRNFQFPHNCHTWKAKICPYDNFFFTNNISVIIDKYEVCLPTQQKMQSVRSSIRKKNLIPYKLAWMPSKSYIQALTGSRIFNPEIFGTGFCWLLGNSGFFGMGLARKLNPRIFGKKCLWSFLPFQLINLVNLLHIWQLIFS